jgi:hypothetical protein
MIVILFGWLDTSNRNDSPSGAIADSHTGIVGIGHNRIPSDLGAFVVASDADLRVP